MFTSGYNDGTNADKLVALGGSVNPVLNRIWKITKFDLIAEV